MSCSITSCPSTPIVGDVGYPFEVQWKNADGTALSVAGATSIEWTFKRPDGTLSGPHAGALSTDGTDGKVKYASAAGVLNQAGDYQVQVRTAAPALGDRRTCAFTFEVRAQLA